MKHLILRLMDVLLTTAIFILALHLLLILFTGGYTYTTYGITIEVRKVVPSIILLLVLVILRFPLKHCGFSRSVLLSHEGTILFSIILMVYLANGKTLGFGDTAPARYLPLSVLREGNFDLDEFPFLYTPGTPHYLPGEIALVRGHWVSNYPVGAALLALPFYLPSALGHVSPESPFLADLEKISAAVIVALSGVILYFAMCRLTSRGMALLITVVYALGTSSLSTSSQALWQHGPSQLALTATLYCLVRSRSEPRWVNFAGLPLAFAVISRPSNLLIALPVGTYVLLHARRHLWGFILSGFLPVLFQLWYNTTYFHNLFRTQWPLLGSGLWTTPFWEGLTGILLSPGRGLLVYSPIFFLSAVGIGLAWCRNSDPLLRYLSIGALLTIMLYSKWVMWWGGHSYGPRLLADLAPILVLFLYPLEKFLQKSLVLKGLFALFVVWSIGAHAIGAFANDRRWNAYMDVDRFPAHLWSWTNNPLVNPPTKVFNRAAIAVRRLPTSVTAPESLSASYRLDLPPAVTTAASQPILFSVQATNDGQAVWLAWAKRDKGVVRLGWRWFNGTQEIPGMAGREPLLYDVSPRKSHAFRTAIGPPQEPGTYLLEIGLVSEHVTWFSDLGISPIRLTVTVEPPR